MITELLTSIFFQANISINRPMPLPKPAITVSAPTPIGIVIQPSSSPTVKPKPKSSKTPKPSSAVKAIQTSGMTTKSILQALNNYRSKNGAGSLQIDNKLQEYAQSRANHLKSIGKLDKHAGHKEFMGSDGFGKLGFNSVAENQSYNYRGDAKGLIEKFYGESAGHNKNQLNPEYTHVGIGINSPFTNLVFGGRKR